MAHAVTPTHGEPHARRAPRQPPGAARAHPPPTRMRVEKALCARARVIYKRDLCARLAGLVSGLQVDNQVDLTHTSEDEPEGLPPPRPVLEPPEPDAGAAPTCPLTAAHGEWIAGHLKRIREKQRHVQNELTALVGLKYGTSTTTDYAPEVHDVLETLLGEELIMLRAQEVKLREASQARPEFGNGDRARMAGMVARGSVSPRPTKKARTTWDPKHGHGLADLQAASVLAQANVRACVHGMYFACVHVYTHVLYVHAPAHMPQASPAGRAKYERELSTFLRAKNARELLQTTGVVIIAANMKPECLVQFRRILHEEVCQSAPCPAYTHAPTHLTHMHSWFANL